MAVGAERLETASRTVVQPHASSGYAAAKRALDVVGAAIGLLVFLPFAAVIALCIRLDSPGPVIYRQQRVKGLSSDGSPILFTFYKFRSMYVNADSEVHRRYVRDLINGRGRKAPLYKLANDSRVTRFGAFLRRASLDEVPQLWNVLIGDMSLVGPRPALPYEFAEYEEWHRQRLSVPQGVTGLWQVSGRSALSFEDMVRLDLEYVRRRSLRLDLWIALRTVWAVLSARGAG